MNEMKRLLSFVRRAVDDYNMIEEGDRIAVGVSGGRTLWHCLRFLPKCADSTPKNTKLLR